MRIVYDKPKLWWLIQRLNPEAEWGNVAMAFGDTIYTSRSLPAHILVHEKVHVRQMRESRLLACLYTVLYGISSKFRLKCELEAYTEQFHYIRDSISDKDAVEKARRILAADMTKPIYKNMVTLEEALELLK